MLLALEFIVIASIVGLFAQSWLVFLIAAAALFGLHASRGRAILSVLLSLGWALAGFHIGLLADEALLPWIAGALCFWLSLRVHQHRQIPSTIESATTNTLVLQQINQYPAPRSHRSAAKAVDEGSPVASPR